MRRFCASPSAHSRRRRRSTNRNRPVPAGNRLLRFQREAMATVFEIFIPARTLTVLPDGERYAAQAAEEAFAELERLEAELSRFRETSDIARLARLREGEELILGVAAFECLKLAQTVHAATGGAFAVAAGRLAACWRSPRGRPRRPSAAELAEARAHSGQDLVELVDARHAVRVRRAGVLVDLGGIGKGYALDRMAALLREWSLPNVLLNAGQSTVLACGGCAAPRGSGGADFSLPAAGFRLPHGTKHARRVSIPIVWGVPFVVACGASQLKTGAVSGSGQGRHGPHIVDPRTGRPATRPAAWAAAPTAAEADALSTAFMVMSEEEVAAFCRRRPEVSALLTVPSGRRPEFRCFGTAFRDAPGAGRTSSPPRGEGGHES